MKIAFAMWRDLLDRLCKNDPTLIELDLSDQQLDASNIHALANALKVNRTLIDLNLASNAITDSAMLALIDALKVNQTLTACHLRSSGLFSFINGNTTNEHLLKKIDSLIERNQFLKGQLFIAVQVGNIQRVESLVEQGVSLLSVIDEGVKKGNTPLHWAIMHKKHAVITLLIHVMRKHSISLTTKNAQGKTAAQLAQQQDIIDLLNDKSAIRGQQSSAHSSQSTVTSAQSSLSSAQTIPANITDENLQQLLVEICNGDKIARLKLVEYFMNVNDEIPAAMLEKHKQITITYLQQALQNTKNVYAQSFLAECYLKGYGVEKNEALALSLIQEGVKQNDAISQYKLGMMYKEGVVVERNYEKALLWLHEAAKQNNATAFCSISDMYSKGIGVEKNEAEAFKWLEKAAVLGDRISGAHAQMKLGCMYRSGRGVVQNDTNALLWFEKSAAQNYGPGQFQLALLYKMGKGVVKNEILAFELFQKAAAWPTFSLAQYELGLAYLAGRGVQKDENKAFHWFCRAAALNDAAAQNQLGIMYRKGLGVKQNSAMAFEYTHKSALQNFQAAQYSLGFMFTDGTGVDVNLQEAFRWFLEAAKQGHVGAMFQVYLCYRDNVGVAENAQEALKWLKAAAEKNDTGAQFLLGLQLQLSEGNADLAEAVKWIRFAAEKNHAGAQRELGLWYFRGQSLEKNYTIAFEWLNKAVEQNDMKAQFFVAWTYYHGSGVKQDYTKALSMLLKVAEQGSVEAQDFLASIYFLGRGVKRDMLEAIKWFKKAALQKSSSAQSRLASIYLQGIGVERDEVAGLAWAHQAAEQNDAAAEYLLGDYFYSTKNNPTVGLKWLQRAAENNFVEAQAMLGEIYARGKNVVKNIPLAIDLLLRAAEKDHVMAQTELAKIYATSSATTKNIPQAIHWLLKAAQLLDTPSYINEIFDQKNAQAVKDMLAKNIRENLAFLEEQGYGDIIAEQQQHILREQQQRQSAENDKKNSPLLLVDHGGGREISKKSITSSTSSLAALTQAPLQVSLEIDPATLQTQQLLGEGAYGRVYYGLWHKLTKVAIKELKVVGLPDKVKEEFRHEAQIMANLRHPSIVQFYGVSFGSQLLLVMEYLANGSLFAKLHSDETMEWPQLIQIALDTTLGLQFLHSQNPTVLHRDIKSLNVLLDRYYNAKLSDFGLAKMRKMIDNESQTQTIDTATVGTTAWMAPELFESVNYTTASDAYALGMMFWEMSARKIPFHNAVNRSLIPMWVAQGKRENIPIETPIKFAELIRGCWQAIPQQRPTTEKIIDELKSIGSSLVTITVEDRATSSTHTEVHYDEATASAHDLPSYDRGVASRL